MTRRAVAYVAAAAICFAVVYAIGASVSNGEPSPFEVSELGQYGVATPLALFLTGTGRFPTYLVLSIAALVFGLVRRAWLTRSLYSVLGLILTWQTSDLLKTWFHRLRPPHPILAETSFGYPSGHADLSIFFYGFWAYAIWKSSLAIWTRATIVGLLVALIAAIGWSRLALGAHYPTDVLGGYFFGAGWLCIALALWARAPRATVAAP